MAKSGLSEGCVLVEKYHRQRHILLFSSFYGYCDIEKVQNDFTLFKITPGVQNYHQKP